MRIKKEKLILSLYVALCGLLLAIIVTFIFRDDILHLSISRLSAKLKTNYNCELKVQKSNIEGFFTINLHNVSLKPNNSDTILNLPSVKISLSFFYILFGNVDVNAIEINGGYIQLTKKGDIRNFDSFIKKTDESLQKDKKKHNFSKKVSKLLEKSIGVLPDDIKINNLKIYIDFNGNNTSLQVRNLTLIDEKLESRIFLYNDKKEQKCALFGILNPDDKKLNIQIVSTENKEINIPFIEKEYQLLFSFNRISLVIKDVEKSDGNQYLRGLSYISNLRIRHPKISKKAVFVKKFKSDCKLFFGENRIALDFGSQFVVNDIKVQPYISYRAERDTSYILKIQIPKMNGQSFVNSLPDGLFDNVQGMEVEGDFEYNLHFAFNKNKPENLVLRSTINKNKLRIRKYGRANLGKMNGEFTYYAMVQNTPQRAIIVGESNTNFARLDEISPLLVKCVLTSEDPSFLTHRGFINEAFKQSIIKNIRTQRFARGASTISMQLVKNVFLTREKTISRKLEEILLVYILENNRIVSKERMLEVYLNIIEWGPDVYGISEASQFYFKKKPSKLTIEECLFLASIIPKPNKFMYKFDDEGNLRSFAQKHNDFILKSMYKRGLLLPGDTQSVDKFRITGRAIHYLKSKPNDSTNADTIPMMEDGFF